MAEMIHGISNNKKNNGNDADNENYEFDPCNVNVIRVSDMTRAKETASIISQYLPQAVIRHDPDPLLNEGM
jgi:broad specificity phosphatase PhoE